MTGSAREAVGNVLAREFHIVVQKPFKGMSSLLPTRAFDDFYVCLLTQVRCLDLQSRGDGL